LSHLAVVQEIYGAFGRGDVPAILGHLAPDVEWEYGAGPTPVPWLQKRHGHAGAQQFFAEVAATLEIQMFAPKSFFEGQGVVVVLLDLEARVKATGKPIHEEDEVHIWHLNAANKVTRFRHRVDTQHHIEACRP
jgi:ketosteroid isomerase-like protein